MADFEIISRHKWGAEPPLSKSSLKHPISYVKVVGVSHVEPCFNMDDCVKAVKEIQHIDMFDGKQQDIRANFLIGDDGHVYEGRGWFSQAPEHPVAHFSGKFLEIGHIGGKGDKPPSREFLMMKQKLIDFGVKKKFLNQFHTVI